MEGGGETVITTPQQLSVLIDELASSTWTLAAIGVLFDSGLADDLVEPRSVDELAARRPSMPHARIERCLAVAAQRGVVAAKNGRYQLAPGVLPHLDPVRRTVLQGDYRSYLLQPAAYLRAAWEAHPGSGWRHTDPAVLQAQGDGSVMFAAGFKASILPELDDLGGRLERAEARFLDVGVGVAALTIAMCGEFPRLRAVGLDPLEVPLALARENVARARLADRVELRQARVEDLADEAAFDLAWLPPFFLGSREVVRRALDRIAVALRPSGWVLVPTINPSAGEAQRAVWSLVMESWGGPALQAPDAEALLNAAGLAPRTFHGPSWISLVAGARRAR
jgi:SAM-dependent methyltransferase